MIRTVLILLFALVSSSALAQHHQHPRHPHPNRVGPCLIAQQQSGGYFYFNVFNGYGNFVASYTDYRMAMDAAIYQDRMGACHGIRTSVLGPAPMPPSSFCQVMQGRDAYGNFFYRVVDRAGRIIYQTPYYQQAFEVSQRDSRCYQ